MSTVSIQELMAQRAGFFGDRIAIEWKDVNVSYSELERATNHLANYLIARGVAKGSLVALLIGDPIKLITTIIGILKAGGVFVPLSPNEPEKRLQSMVLDIEPDLFIIESAFSVKLSNLSSSGPRVRAVIIDQAGGSSEWSNNLREIGDSLIYKNFSRPGLARESDDMCYLYFTSGSTGTPKGIAGRLKSLLHFVRWEIETLGINHEYRISQLSIPTFDAFLRDIFVPLCAGATICIPENRDAILDTRKLMAWMDDRKIRLMHCVPSLFRALVREKLNPEQFQSLKYIIMAGEPIFPSEIRKWMAIFHERVQLVSLYGATENTMAKFCYFIGESDQHRKTIPIGKPIPGAKAIILDSDGALCDPGVVGEIYIRTPYLTLGYYRHPELTEQVFIPNPFSKDPQDIIYKTGDLGRVLPDGNFEFLGRKDHQVKIRGFRVELGEIEAVLKQHPNVQEAVVLTKGEEPDDRRLLAYIVTDPDQKPAVSELQRFVRENLPEYMVPSAFVRLDAMPLTPNGKVDREALPEADLAEPALESTYAAPRTSFEELLVGIWSEVLRVAPVGIHDNFFARGGHSLLATQVISRVREACQVELPLHSLFENPTVAGLAAVITQSQVEQKEFIETQILEMVDQLSEADIDAMLEQFSGNG